MGDMKPVMSDLDLDALISNFIEQGGEAAVIGRMYAAIDPRTFQKFIEAERERGTKGSEIFYSVSSFFMDIMASMIGQDLSPEDEAKFMAGFSELFTEAIRDKSARVRAFISNMEGVAA